jgi:hypothetical protein
MKTLYMKDLRVNWIVVFTGLIIGAGPWILAPLLVSEYGEWDLGSSLTWARILKFGSIFSILCSQATLGLLSGNLIATERADRSAEFLAYLPPSKIEILGSKILVLVTAVVLIWGVNLPLYSIALHLIPSDPLEGTGQIRSMLTMCAAAGICAIGSGWIASSYVSSPAIAALCAMMGPMFVSLSILASSYFLEWPVTESDYVNTLKIAFGVVGIVLFSAGSLYFVRRVEP